MPDWDGYYRRDTQADRGSEWIWGVTQAPTVLSLLTPEYQKRMVQTIYHEAVTNAPQWSASFCWPEGFIRWWAQPSQAGNFQLTMTTWQVQFLSGIADNFLRQVMIGKQHVQKVPQWYGETIGFWDGTTLVTWTANIQGWQLSHAMFETSDKLETVETFKPVLDASGKFVGLDHEAIFYDPDAFVAPVRASVSFCQGRDPGRSRTPVHVHRVPEQYLQHGRPAEPDDCCRSSLRGLLRPAVGQELGEELRGRVGEAGRTSSRRPSPISSNSVARYPQYLLGEAMTTRTIGALTAAASLAMLAMVFKTPVSTHHSFAMYDQTKVVTLTGVVKQFVPQANHAELHFYPDRARPQGIAKGADGKNVEWGVEMAGTAAVAQQGITSATFGQGTVFSVKLNPLRDGTNFGSRVGAIAKCPVDEQPRSRSCPRQTSTAIRSRAAR